MNFLYEHHSSIAIRDTLDKLGISPWNYHKYIQGLSKADAEFKVYFLSNIFKYPINGDIYSKDKKELVAAFLSLSNADRRRVADFGLLCHISKIGTDTSQEVLQMRFPYCVIRTAKSSRNSVWLSSYLKITDIDIPNNDAMLSASIISTFGSDPSIRRFLKTDRAKELCDILMKYEDPRHIILLVMLHNKGQFSTRMIKSYIKIKFDGKLTHKNIIDFNYGIFYGLAINPTLFQKLCSRGYITFNNDWISCMIDTGIRTEDLFNVLIKLSLQKYHLSLYLTFYKILLTYGKAAKNKWSPIYIKRDDIIALNNHSQAAVGLFSIDMLVNKFVSTRVINEMSPNDCAADITLAYLFGSPMTNIVDRIKRDNREICINVLTETNLTKIPDLYVIYGIKDTIIRSGCLRALIKHKKIMIDKTPTTSDLDFLANELGPDLKDIITPSMQSRMTIRTANWNSLPTCWSYKKLLWSDILFSGRDVQLHSLDAQEWIYKNYPSALKVTNKLFSTDVYMPRIKAVQGFISKLHGDYYIDLYVITQN